MHVFQPMDAKEIDFNVFHMIGEDGYVVVTQKGDKTNAITANFGGLGTMWGKDCVFIVLRDSSFSRELLDATGTFSVNFLNPKKYRTVMRYFGAASGRQEDKIAAMKLNLNQWEEISFLDEANTVFCARKIHKIEVPAEGIIDQAMLPKWYQQGDQYSLYIGEILQVMAR